MVTLSFDPFRFVTASNFAVFFSALNQRDIKQIICFLQPVRAELMQALWRTLRNPSEDIAHVAFRVLGKFGGSNRKMLKEAQRLGFDESSSIGPCLKVAFDGLKNPVHVPVQFFFFCFTSIIGMIIKIIFLL